MQPIAVVKDAHGIVTLLLRATPFLAEVCLRLVRDWLLPVLAPAGSYVRGGEWKGSD